MGLNLDDNDLVKKEFSCTLKEISAKVIRRLPPCDIIPIKTNDYSPTFSCYLKYYDKIESNFRKRLLEALIEKAKYNIESSLEGTHESFSEIFPQYGRLIRDFFNWMKENKYTSIDEDSVLRIFSHRDENINIVSIIKTVFKEELPEFKYCKKRHITGACKIHSC